LISKTQFLAKNKPITGSHNQNSEKIISIKIYWEVQIKENYLINSKEMKKILILLAESDDNFPENLEPSCLDSFLFLFV